MTTTIQHPTADQRLAQVRSYLADAAIAGCACDTSARETAMHLRRAVGELTTLVDELLAEVGR